MAKGSTINVRILGENKDFRAALQDSESRATKFGGKVGKAVAAGLATVAVGAVAIGAASVKQASDLAESANAVAVTFEDQAAGISALAKEAATGVGLSASEFNGLAVQFAGFAKGIAGPGGDVVSTIDDITKRSADFASVMNLDVADSAALFQSALAGETEGMRKFGVDMSAVAVESYALANGIADTASEMTEADKVQARYGILMAETAKTAGDFANTSDGVANQQRVLSARIKDLSATFGTALLPILEDVAGFVSDKVVPALERHMPTAIAAAQAAIALVVTAFGTLFGAASSIYNFFNDNQHVLAGVAAAVGVVLVAATYAYVTALWAQAAAWVAANAGLLATIAVVAAVAVAIGALVAAVVWAYQNFETFRTVVDTVRTWIVDTLWPAIQTVAAGIVEAITVMIGAVKAVISTVTAAITVIWETWGDEILAYITNAFETIRTVVESVIGVIRGIIQTVTSLIRGDWQGVWDGIKLIVSSTWDGIKGIVSGALDSVKIGLDAAVDGIKLALTKPYNEAKDLIVETVNSIVSFIGGMPNRLTDMAGDFLSAGLGLGSSILRGIVDGISGAVEIVGDIASAVASAVGSAVKTAANGVIDGVNRALEFTIKGPGFLPDIRLNPPDIRRFHTGGVVPGPIGSEVPIMALAGETVFTRGQVAALGAALDGRQQQQQFPSTLVLEVDGRQMTAHVRSVIGDLERERRGAL